MTDKHFISRLMEIREMFGLPKLKIFVHTTAILGENPTDKEWSDFVILNRKIVSGREQFLESCNADIHDLLFEMIDLILEDVKLGQEWKFPLLDFLLSGYITPPMNNLVIKSDVGAKKVSLEINRNTTMKDIKTLWPTIQKSIVAVDGEIPQKRYLKGNFNEHLILLSKASNIQKKNPNVKGLDLVSRITPELTDNSEMPSSEQDKRMSANIRQIKRRFKAR